MHKNYVVSKKIDTLPTDETSAVRTGKGGRAIENCKFVQYRCSEGAIFNFLRGGMDLFWNNSLTIFHSVSVW